MIPKLPTDISLNGIEIWEWAAKLSEHVQRLDRQRTLRRELRRLSSECGSCRWWMTRDCPAEKPSNTGYSRGPSMGAPICAKFELSSTSRTIQQQWQDELAQLKAALDTREEP